MDTSGEQLASCASDAAAAWLNFFLNLVSSGTVSSIRQACIRQACHSGQIRSELMRDEDTEGRDLSPAVLGAVGEGNNVGGYFVTSLQHTT